MHKTIASIMKKLFVLFVMLVPLIVVSQGNRPAASSIGYTSNQQFNQPTGNRSVPPGILVWSQLPNCEGDIWSSQSDLVYPFDSKVADDFLFTSEPGAIGIARWWIGWWNPGNYAAPSSFNIFIYNDLNCRPGNLVAQWNIPLADAHEDAGCLVILPSREYWAELNPPFQPVVNQHYWIVFQPVLVYPPQTGMVTCTSQALCTARLDFPLNGYSWADLATDTAFELYAYSEVPVANWALILGGVMIAVAVYFRARRAS
jgi:hypothetical protein